MPVMSLGSRSGVAWMRLNSPPIERASARANVVLPTPGTPSSKRLPSANRQIAAVSDGFAIAGDDELDVVDQPTERVRRLTLCGRRFDHVGSFDGPRSRA